MTSQANNLATTQGVPQQANVANVGAMALGGAVDTAGNQTRIELGMTRGGIQLNILKPIHEIIPKKARVLNSWIAFRTYYSPIFDAFQQREISVFLTALWQADPAKGEWAVIASAYTIIRDMVGKDLAPLDRFLTLICPQMNITSVGAYMAHFHWALHQTDDGSYFVSQAKPDVVDNTGNNGGPAVLQDDLQLVLYAINHGYMPSRAQHETYLAALTTANNIKSVATMGHDQARAAFNHALQYDTTSLGAMILGIDMDHVFFTEVIYDPTVIPAVDNTNNDMMQQYDEQENAGRALPVGPAESTSAYQWAGQMNELFNRDEAMVTLPSATTGQNTGAAQGTTTTDITDPIILDNHLMMNGHSAEQLRPDLPDDLEMTYNFSDSF